MVRVSDWWDLTMASDELQKSGGSVRYEEVQHFHPAFQALMVGIGLFLLVSLVADVVFHTPLGSKPAPPAVLAGVLVFFVLLYLWVFRLVVRVDGQSVRAEFGYLGRLNFRWTRDQIRSCEPVTYRPLRDFGGWGIRFGAGGKRCYSARGNRGVLLETDKRQVTIGSQRPEELAAAIQQLIGQ